MEIPEAASLDLTGTSDSCLDGNFGQCFMDGITLPHYTYDTILSLAGSAATSVVDDVAGSAWYSICTSFAAAFTSMFQWFGKAFA